MWQDMKNFLGRPYHADMNALDWFLFLGLIIVLMVMWRIILKHIVETIE